MTVERVLFPTDFSDTAEHALECACDLARQFDAGLHLLHVVRDPKSQDWAGEGAGIVIPDLLETWSASNRITAGVGNSPRYFVSPNFSIRYRIWSRAARLLV